MSLFAPMADNLRILCKEYDNHVRQSKKGSVTLNDCRYASPADEFVAVDGRSS